MIEKPFRLFEQFEDELRLGIVVRDDTEKWPENRCSDEAMGELFGVTDVAGLHQEHGSTSIRVSEPVARDKKADGLVTDTSGLLLTTRWADCQNFVVYAPERRVAGLVHAGWRGLLAGVLPGFWELLQSEWGIAPEETYVGAGPSLCQECADFTDPSAELPGIDPKFFDGRNVNLRGIADVQLDDIGVPEEQRERTKACTRCVPEFFWTYRGGHAEEVKSGCTNALCCMLM